MICGPSAVSSNPKAERFLRASQATDSVPPSRPDPPTHRSPAKARLAPPIKHNTQSHSSSALSEKSLPITGHPPVASRPGLVPAATQQHPPPIQRPSQRRPGHATPPRFLKLSPLTGIARLIQPSPKLTVALQYRAKPACKLVQVHNVRIVDSGWPS